MSAGQLTIDRRNMIKRGDRIRFLKSLRSKTKRKTTRAMIKV
jgi:hypothetical protein